MSRMQHRVVCYPMFQGISHQTAFSEGKMKMNWESWVHAHTHAHACTRMCTHTHTHTHKHTCK